MVVIVNDVLDFEKIQANKVVLERIPVNVRTLVNELFKNHSQTATSKGLLLVPYVAENVPQQIIGKLILLLPSFLFEISIARNMSLNYKQLTKQ